MKATKQWLKETLPENLYLSAIENSTEEILNIEVTNFSVAISGAFLWQKSKQGYTYWRKICKQYE